MMLLSMCYIMVGILLIPHILYQVFYAICIYPSLSDKVCDIMTFTLA